MSIYLVDEVMQRCQCGEHAFNIMVAKVSNARTCQQITQMIGTEIFRRNLTVWKLPLALHAKAHATER